MTGESLAALRVQLGLKTRDAISRRRRFLLGFSIAREIVQPVIVAAHFDVVNFVLDELVHGCPADLHSPAGDNIFFRLQLGTTFLLGRLSTIGMNPSARLQNILAQMVSSQTRKGRIPRLSYCSALGPMSETAVTSELRLYMIFT